MDDIRGREDFTNPVDLRVDEVVEAQFSCQGEPIVEVDGCAIRNLLQHSSDNGPLVQEDEMLAPLKGLYGK